MPLCKLPVSLQWHCAIMKLLGKFQCINIVLVEWIIQYSTSKYEVYGMSIIFLEINKVSCDLSFTLTFPVCNVQTIDVK